MKNYSKFIELSNKIIISNFNNELLTEGLIRSVDYDFLIKKLKDLFYKYGKSIRIYENVTPILMKIVKNSFNKKLYDEFLSLLRICGYSISYHYYDFDNSPIIGEPSVVDIFSDNYEYMYLNLIKKFDIENYGGVPEYLYHVTDKKNVEKILEIGLVPRSKNKIEKHPDRIYLTDSLEGANDFKEMIQFRFSDNIVILKINSKLLKSIKLYYDPTFFENEKSFEESEYKAFYTYDNITPYAIEIINEN